MSNTKLIGAALLGIVAGAVVGIILAPRSGKDSRKRIGNACLDLLNNITGKVENAVNSLDNGLNDAEVHKDQQVDERYQKYIPLKRQVFYREEMEHA